MPRDLPPPDIRDVEIEDVWPSGDGLAYVGREPIRVPFVIPGERVRLEVRRRPRGLSFSVVELLRASPHRVKPRCQHFGPDGPGADPGPCGGCAWQHIAYPEQLRLKTALLERLIRAEVPNAAVSPMRAATPLDAPWGYRQKVHFVFGSTGNPRRPVLEIGHYVRGSRELIPIAECPVHDPRGNEAAFALHRAYGSLGVRAADHPQGELRSITFRVGHGTPELMGTVVVTDDGDARLRSATRRFLDNRPDVTGFHLNVHTRDDGFIFGRETRTIRGPARLRERVGDTSYLVSPTAFFQTNVAAAGLLVQLVIEAIPEGARVLDLYAGAGLFAIPLARAGHQVLAVEENRAAIADGEAAARLNKVDPARCRFVAQRAEQAVANAAGGAGAGSFDAVVIDPPRDGCAPEVIDALFGRLRPATVAYVSCNPEALARELGDVVRLGYRIRSIVPVDMFPHTAHIETVVVLTR